MDREELAQYVKDMQDGFVATHGRIIDKVWAEGEVDFYDQLQDIRLELEE